MNISVIHGYMEYEGIVKNIEKSLIPQVYIASIENPEVKTLFDIHKSLMVFKLNDVVRVTISKVKPQYKDGVDLVMSGYVIGKKSIGKELYKVLISLWGYLLIIETKNEDVFKLFNYMDEVYFKLEVIKHVNAFK